MLPCLEEAPAVSRSCAHVCIVVFVAAFLFYRRSLFGRVADLLTDWLQLEALIRILNASAQIVSAMLISSHMLRVCKCAEGLSVALCTAAGGVINADLANWRLCELLKVSYCSIHYFHSETAAKFKKALSSRVNIVLVQCCQCFCFPSEFGAISLRGSVSRPSYSHISASFFFCL